MIDIENELFDIVATDLRTEFPGIFVSGEYVKSPSAFPAVSLVVIDNTSYQQTADSKSNENHVLITVETNVYSNKASGKKTECKAIVAYLDGILLRLGFSRTMLEPIPNLDDASIYRMIGRYSAVVSKNQIIYRR